MVLVQFQLLAHRRNALLLWFLRQQSTANFGFSYRCWQAVNKLGAPDMTRLAPTCLKLPQPTHTHSIHRISVLPTEREKEEKRSGMAFLEAWENPVCVIVARSSVFFFRLILLAIKAKDVATFSSIDNRKPNRKEWLWSGPGFICIYRIYRIYRPWWWWFKLIINIKFGLLICNTYYQKMFNTYNLYHQGL